VAIISVREDSLTGNRYLPELHCIYLHLRDIHLILSVIVGKDIYRLQDYIRASIDSAISWSARDQQ